MHVLVIVHYTVCALLLLPPALEYGWLADTRTRRLRPALKQLFDELLRIGGELWANTQRAMEQWNRGRERVQRRQNKNNT